MYVAYNRGAYHFTNVYKRSGQIIKYNNKIKITIIGDSLSCDPDHIKATTKYCDLLEAHDNCIIQSMAVDGHGYKRDDDNVASFWKQAQKIENDTDLVLVFGSFNDMKHISQLGEITDTGTDTICGCINTTIQNIYNIKESIKIGIMTPTPWNVFKPGQENSEKYVKAIIDICNLNGIPYLDLFHKSQLRPYDLTFNSIYFGNADGTHPNNNGHKDYIYPMVKNFLHSII